MSRDISPMAAAAFLVSLDQLQLEPDMTPMKLQKLMYIAQANYLASTNRRLFSATVEAFEHGPVVYSVWREYSGQEIIRPEAHRNLDEDIPEDVEAFLSKVWQKFGSKSASWLRRYTHTQEPWLRNYNPDGFRCVIPDQDMVSYYQQCVPANERILHQAVVTVPATLLDEDAEADAALRAFLHR
ncbi:putative phage-associated protein [Microbacterium paludicola]|uniref:Phage-associated protein n=1 Tax=Microbacterium paludicola TaxID=300019 RepID=A0ABU1I5I2_9MICO|nr:type II toxin-antitoxin system antitoxin SocA domain-containing protein [Microbacterium paludicola]MDR6168762.1 putative phage-associated protein [Microbacterium paludicola]